MFKRIVVAFFILASFVAPLAVSAGYYGLEESGDKGGYTVNNGQSSFTISGFITTAIKAVLGFIAIILFLFILYSGLRWMTAQGNEEAIAQAKDTLQTTLVGFLVVVAAYGVTTLIFNLLSGE